MPCITDQDLANLEAAATSQLPDLCDIYDPPTGQTRTPGGGFTPNTFPTNWTKTSGVACRLSPTRQRSDERPAAGAMAGVTYWDLTLPQSAVITSKSRVIITSLGNRQFLVRGVLNGSFDFDTLCEVEEVTS